METPLTQREFDRWREDDRAFKEQVLAHFANQTETNTEVNTRVTRLEAYRERDAVRLGIWASLVGAIIGGITSVLAGKVF